MSAPSSPSGHTETLTVPQALSLADQRLAAGDAAAAEALCQAVLARDPACGRALHSLGVIAAFRGDLTAAVGFVRRATATPGAPALYFCNLCEMCRQAGELDAALAAGRRASRSSPATRRRTAAASSMRWPR